MPHIAQTLQIKAFAKAMQGKGGLIDPSNGSCVRVKRPSQISFYLN